MLWFLRARHGESDDDAANRQTASLAGLAVVLALVVVCLHLIHALGISGQVEDCLMAGRHDCDRLASLGRF